MLYHVYSVYMQLQHQLSICQHTHPVPDELSLFQNHVQHMCLGLQWDNMHFGYVLISLRNQNDIVLTDHIIKDTCKSGLQNLKCPPKSGFPVLKYTPHTKNWLLGTQFHKATFKWTEVSTLFDNKSPINYLLLFLLKFCTCTTYPKRNDWILKLTYGYGVFNIFVYRYIGSTLEVFQIFKPTFKSCFMDIWRVLQMAGRTCLCNVYCLLLFVKRVLIFYSFFLFVCMF